MSAKSWPFILALGLEVFILLSILVSLCLFLRYYALVPLKHRSRPILWLCVLGLGGFLCLQLLPLLQPWSVSWLILPQVWLQAAGWPLIALLLAARAWRLAILRKFHERRLHEFKEEIYSELYEQESQWPQQQWSVAVDVLLNVTPALRSLSFRSPSSSSSSSVGSLIASPFSAWETLYIVLEKEWIIALIAFIAYIAICGVLFLVPSHLFLWIGHGAAAVTLFLLLPVALWLLRRWNDPRGMRTEVLLSTPLTWLALLFDLNRFHFLPLTAINEESSVLTASVLLLPAFVGLCVMPAWQTVRLRLLTPSFTSSVVPASSSIAAPSTGNNTSGTYQPRVLRLFEDFLRNRKEMRRFKEFCIRDFTVENILFYQRVRMLMQRLSSASGAQGMDATQLEWQLHGLYNMFIKNGAKFQVKISQRIRERIYDDMTRGILSVEGFRQAQEEVLRRMWRDSWPRFAAELREKRSVKKERTDAGAGREGYVRRWCNGNGEHDELPPRPSVTSALEKGVKGRG